MEDIVFGLPKDLDGRSDWLRLVSNSITRESDYRDLAFCWRDKLLRGEFDIKKESEFLEKRSEEKLRDRLEKIIGLMEE